MPTAPDIADLVERLRARGLPLTAGEVADALRVVEQLARTVPGDQQDYATLQRVLRSVLCKSPIDVPAFDEVYAAWRATAATPRTIGYRLPPLIAQSVRWVNRPGIRIVIVAMLLGVVVTAYVLGDRVESPATPTIAPQPDGTAAAPPPAAGSETTPPATPSVEPASVDMSSNRIGFTPRFRVNEEIRPVWLLAPALVGLLLAALLFATALPQLQVSRRRGLAQQRAGAWPASPYERQLAGELAPATQSRLHRHTLRAADDSDEAPRRALPDLRRTVEATVSRLGLPRLQFRAARQRPSYLVLVGADGPNDYPMLWAARLGDLDLRVDRFLVSGLDGESPTCLEISGSGRRFAFDQLPHPEPGQRLILIARLAALFEPAGVPADATTNKPRLRQWAYKARLQRWRQRVLFTPEEPRRWNDAQVAELERTTPGDAGMYVLPLDENALASWSEWLVSGQFPVATLVDYQRYPVLLDAHPERFVGDAPLERLAATPRQAAAAAADTVSALQAYLGRNGFYWLCACALAPVLKRNLALLIGERYFANCATPPAQMGFYLAQSWRKLGRLPWFRGDDDRLPPMPTWLRLLLLDRLPESIQDELRDVISAALKPAESASASDLPVIVDPDDRSATLSEAHALFVGFVQERHSAQRLLLRASPQWASLARRAARESRWQGRWSARLARWVWRDGLPGRGLRLRTALLGIAGIGLCGAGVLALWRVDLDALPPRLRMLLFREVTYAVAADLPAPPSALAYGRRLAVTATGNSLQLWDAATALPVGTPILAMEPINALALNPDDTLVAVAGTSKVELFNVATGANRLTVASDAVSNLAFTDEGDRIVATLREGDTRAWDLQGNRAEWSTRCLVENQPITVSPDLTELYGSPVFYSSGRRVPCRPLNSISRPIDTIAGALLANDFVALSPDDHLSVINIGAERAPATEKRVATPPGTREIAASLDERQLVTASDSRLQFWLRSTDAALPYATLPQTTRLALSDDGGLAARRTTQGRIELIDPGSGRVSDTLLTESDAALHLSFSPDARRLVATDTKTTQIWRIDRRFAAEDVMRTWRIDLRDRASLLLTRPAATNVVFGEESGRIAVLYDDRVEVYHERVLLHTFPSGARIATFDRAERRLTVVTPTGSVARLDIESRVTEGIAAATGRRDRAATGASQTSSVALDTGIEITGTDPAWGEGAVLSRYGRYVVVDGEPGERVIWNTETREGKRFPAPERDEAVYTEQFSPDERLMAMASSTSDSVILFAATATVAGSCASHQANPLMNLTPPRTWFATFSPSGSTLMTITPDGVQFCDIATQRTVAQIPQPYLGFVTGQVDMYFGWSSEETAVLAQTESDMVKVWHFPVAASAERTMAAVSPITTLRQAGGWLVAGILVIGFFLGAAIRRVQQRLKPTQRPIAARTWLSE